MNKADWQKLTVRELTEEEKDFFWGTSKHYLGRSYT